MTTSKETYTSVFHSTTNSSVYGNDFQDTKNNLANNSGLGTSSGYSSGYFGGATSSTVREQGDNLHDKDANNDNNKGEHGTSEFNITNNVNLSSASFVQDERLAQEVLEKAGPADKYQRKEYVHDISGKAAENEQFSTSSFHENNENFTQSTHNTIAAENNYPNNSTSSMINQDPDPIRILKPNNQNIVYKQQVNIRYLQPPTPPPPAPIIIREKQLPPPPAQPPIIIR